MSRSSNKTVVIIAGPTAVGKTAIAVETATLLNTEIISADSRQCYKEMRIGVARPSPEELETVKHHFIASHSIHEKVNAGVFADFALDRIDEIFKTRDIVVMAGGTGLYIKAFAEGMDEIPLVPENIREEVIAGFDKQGLAWLQQELKEKDPDFYSQAEVQNPQRLMRALEVINATGKSILNFRTGEKQERPFNTIRIGLELEKRQLHQNINTRVEKMIELGLVEEVRGLLPNRYLNALQTVGYSEIFDYLDGKSSLGEAAEKIKINTRQYAKRQMTWFKKDKTIHWVDPGTASVSKTVKTLIH